MHSRGTARLTIDHERHDSKMTVDSRYSVRQLANSDASRYRDLMLDAYENFSEAFTSTANERRGKSLSWWEERIASDDGTSVGFGAIH